MSRTDAASVMKTKEVLMQVLPGTKGLKLAVAVVAVVATAETAGSRAQDDETLTADLAIAQTHVNTDGQRLPGSAPAARYRLERRLGSAGATTTLTLVELERATADGAAGEIKLDNPFLAVRTELDPKGGLRLYNRRGDLLREPTAADRRLFGIVNPAGGPNAPDSRPMAARGGRAKLLVEANLTHERRAEVERHFGPPVDRVRGLDRYVASRGGDVDEVLLDPITALPYELNTVKGGVLVSRLLMTYELTGRVFIRRSFRSERALADTARRVVTTIDVTNVQLVTGGGQ